MKTTGLSAAPPEQAIGLEKMGPGAVFDALGKLTSVVSAKAYVEAQPIVAELMTMVHAMSRENQAQADEIDKLRKEIGMFKDFRATAKKYQAKTEDTGVVSMVLISPSPGQEAHRYCANCFAHSKIRLLQPTNETTLHSDRRGWYRNYVCHDPECEAKMSFNFVQAYNPPRPMGGSYFDR